MPLQTSQTANIGIKLLLRLRKIIEKYYTFINLFDIHFYYHNLLKFEAMHKLLTGCLYAAAGLSGYPGYIYHENIFFLTKEDL